MEFPILSAIVWTPVVALIAVLIIPGTQAAAIRVVSAIAALFTLVCTVWLWFTFDASSADFQFVERIPWIPGWGIDYHLGVDGFSVLLLVLTAIVYFTGVLTMWHMGTEQRVKEFFAFMHLLLFGVFGVFSSLDLFAFFFFYEIAVLPMYPLIAIWGSTKKEYAAMKLTLFLMAGSALLFPALASVYWVGGVDSWSIPDLMAVEFSAQYQFFVYPFLYLGFGVLAGMFPFHTWSPTGHVAAPTAVSMIHAGVLMKLGAYGILRVAITLFPEGAADWAGLFGALATVNIVYGAFVAMKQTDFKYVIGFSSVSHMGIVLLGLNTMSVDGINGAVFQMFAHGVMTALFFSAVGFIYEQTHDRTIGNFGGLVRQVPVAGSFFIVAGLCGIGVPGFASFWAELLVFIAAIKTMPILGVLAVLGLVFTSLYMLRVFGQAFFGPVNEKWNHLREPTAFEAIPRVLLVLVLIGFGFFPSAVLDLIGQATAGLLGRF
jgi:NADH-quinone oxidoreductase subunit M